MKGEIKIKMSSVISVMEDRIISSGFAEEEMMIMDMESGNYLNLNPVGTAIWKFIEHPITVEDICNTLTEKYDDVEPEVCREQVFEFLNILLKQSVIQVK